MMAKRSSPPSSEEAALTPYQNAWAAIRMIREAIERLGPPGALISEEAVLLQYGPEPVHEGQAIVDALTKLLNRDDAS
jgi:hypothetical protein